jgi:hypothetical protein
VAREGYPALGKRRAKLESDIFRSRLLLRPVVVMGGEEAVRFFMRPMLSPVGAPARAL